MKEKGLYSHCPNCSNIKSGTTMFRCVKCGSIFCAACVEEGGWEYGGKCPRCHSWTTWDFGSNVTELGEIK